MAEVCERQRRGGTRWRTYRIGYVLTKILVLVNWLPENPHPWTPWSLSDTTSANWQVAAVFERFAGKAGLWLFAEH